MIYEGKNLGRERESREVPEKVGKGLIGEGLKKLNDGIFIQ